MSQAPSQAPKGRAKAKPKPPPEEYKFDVTPYLLPDAQVIDTKLIKLDLDMKFGQIRKVDNAHAMALVKDLTDNPPTELTLTVWQDSGH
jgi:hypothetical protein